MMAESFYEHLQRVFMNKCTYLVVPGTSEYANPLDVLESAETGMKPLSSSQSDKNSIRNP